MICAVTTYEQRKMRKEVAAGDWNLSASRMYVTAVSNRETGVKMTTMHQPPQTGKRIVSKGEYAANVMGKLSGTSGGLLLVLLGIFAGVMGILLVIVCCVCFFHPSEEAVRSPWWEYIGLAVFASVMLGGGAAALISVGVTLVNDSKRMEPVVPLTRANTADLPAPTSLVRATAEPEQEQQSVLLRAATASVERHEEQLVRASARGTE